MKKLIYILLVGLLTYAAMPAYSQNTTTLLKSSLGNTTDTITDAGTTYVSTAVNGVYKVMSIQAVVTKISGTVAGTVILYASNDGTNYEAITTDTLTLSNVTTNTKIWVIDKTPYLYYKVVGVGSGTMAAQLKAYLLPSPFGSGKHEIIQMKSSTNNISDTVTNTGTEYLKVQLANFYEKVSFQAVVTRVSGTAAGTVTLQGSDDGTNFVTVASAYVNEQTYTVTNTALQANLFLVTSSPYLHYRLSYSGSGTMVCTLKGYCLPSR